jgi:hypothetical protein
MCATPVRLITVPLLSLLIAAAAAQLPAQTTSVIQGRLVDAQGLAIAGADIGREGQVGLRIEF